MTMTERVADRPPGWRNPPDGVPRQCWNIWSLQMKRKLSQEEAYSEHTRFLRNPGFGPYYCKNCEAYHLGHRSSKPVLKVDRHEDLMVELGIRAISHLLMEDSHASIRKRCQTAAEKRGEYGTVK